MNPGEQAFKSWAPDNSVWSRWAKPVLFAEMMRRQGIDGDSLDWRGVSLSGIPDAEEQNAILVDLPGAQSVAMGMALASIGYRPVPLFNAASALSAIVNVEPISTRLYRWADELAGMNIAADAPPAFLIDDKRLGDKLMVVPGRFDNRSVVFPQDFPSAEFMLSKGIRAVILLRDAPRPIESDLGHVLCRWQEKQLPILLKSALDGKAPEKLVVSKPGNFKSLLYRAMVLVGLARNSMGGFGAIVPQPSSSGGYG